MDGQQSEPYLIYLLNDKNQQVSFTTVLPYSVQPFPAHEFTGLQPLTAYTITFVYNGIKAFKTSVKQKTRKFCQHW